jgi:hypothetical protein
MKKTTFLSILAIVCLFVFSNTQAQNNENSPSWGFAPTYNPDLNPNHNLVLDNAPTSIARGINNTGATTAIFGKWTLSTPAAFTAINSTFNGASFAGTLGPDGKYYCIDNGPPVNLYSVDTATGVKTLVAPVTGLFGTEGWTELAYDKSTLTWYASSGSATSSSLYTFNITTGVATRVGAINTGLIITIAINPITNAMFGVDIVTDNVVSINKTTGVGTTVGPIGFNSNFGAGSAFDELGVWYFASIDAGAGNARNFYTLNTTTGTATLVGSFPATAQVSSLGIPLPVPPPAVSDSTLVILQDTLIGSATQIALKKADNDSMKVALLGYVGKTRIMYRDSSQASIPNLRSYKNVIFVETSFITPNRLKAPWRDSIRAYLNSGSIGNKKSFIVFGGDFAYNYGPGGAGGTNTDTNFCNAFGFKFIMDDGSLQKKMTGVAINTGISDSLFTYANYYPDGVRPLAGSTVLEQWTGRIATDTVAGVGMVTPIYTTASIFVDPRYVGNTAGVTNRGWRPLFKSVVEWVKNNGGTITGVGINPGMIADKFVLSQNYPNPFNPTTKINFSIPTNGFVTMKIFDVAGKEVMTLVNKSMTVGNYTVDFNGTALSSGVYFYRLESGSFVETKKMMLVK